MTVIIWCYFCLTPKPGVISWDHVACLCMRTHCLLLFFTPSLRIMFANLIEREREIIEVSDYMYEQIFSHILLILPLTISLLWMITADNLFSQRKSYYITFILPWIVWLSLLWVIYLYPRLYFYFKCDQII